MPDHGVDLRRGVEVAFKHHNGYDAIRFSVIGISGTPAVGGYLLRFSVGYLVHPWRREWGDARPTFRDIVARVELGNERLRLGTAVPEANLVLASTDHPQELAIHFELLVSNIHVEHLERIRCGGDLKFTLRFAGERAVGPTAASEYDEVHYTAEQPKWIQVLEGMGYGHFLLCELHIDPVENDDLLHVWKALEHAGKQIHTGHYNGAVADCRRAIEAAVKISGLESELKKIVEKRRSGAIVMSKAERLLNVLDAIRHATQLSVHVDSENELVEYSRDEALLIYGTTAASMRDMAARLAAKTSKT